MNKRPRFPGDRPSTALNKGATSNWMLDGRRYIGIALVGAYRTWQREGTSGNQIAGRLFDMKQLFSHQAAPSRDFH